jgi:hypothetical protein
VSNSRNARTFERDKRREFWSAHIRIFGPSAAPCEMSRPAAMSSWTSTDRLARLALWRAWTGNQPFGAALLKAAIAEVEPSPVMDAGRLQ